MSLSNTINRVIQSYKKDLEQAAITFLEQVEKIVENFGLLAGLKDDEAQMTTMLSLLRPLVFHNTPAIQIKACSAIAVLVKHSPMCAKGIVHDAEMIQELGRYFEEAEEPDRSLDVDSTESSEADHQQFPYGRRVPHGRRVPQCQDVLINAVTHVPDQAEAVFEILGGKNFVIEKFKQRRYFMNYKMVDLVGRLACTSEENAAACIPALFSAIEESSSDDETRMQAILSLTNVAQLHTEQANKFGVMEALWAALPRIPALGFLGMIDVKLRCAETILVLMDRGRRDLVHNMEFDVNGLIQLFDTLGTAYGNEGMPLDIQDKMVACIQHLPAEHLMLMMNHPGAGTLPVRVPRAMMETVVQKLTLRQEQCAQDIRNVDGVQTIITRMIPLVGKPEQKQLRFYRRSLKIPNQVDGGAKAKELAPSGEGGASDDGGVPPPPVEGGARNLLVDDNILSSNVRGAARIEGSEESLPLMQNVGSAFPFMLIMLIFIRWFRHQ